MDKYKAVDRVSENMDAMELTLKLVNNSRREE